MGPLQDALEEAKNPAAMAQVHVSDLKVQVNQERALRELKAPCLRERGRLSPCKSNSKHRTTWRRTSGSHTSPMKHKEARGLPSLSWCQ